MLRAHEPIARRCLIRVEPEAPVHAMEGESAAHGLFLKSAQEDVAGREGVSLDPEPTPPIARPPTNSSGARADDLSCARPRKMRGPFSALG